MKEITIEDVENDIFLMMRKYFGNRVEIDILNAQAKTREMLGEFIEKYMEVLDS